MICDICKNQKGYAVFNEDSHRFVVRELNSLLNICFDCFETVPKHIPQVQIRNYLERKVVI